MDLRGQLGSLTMEIRIQHRPGETTLLVKPLMAERLVASGDYKVKVCHKPYLSVFYKFLSFSTSCNCCVSKFLSEFLFKSSPLIPDHALAAAPGGQLRADFGIRPHEKPRRPALCGVGHDAVVGHPCCCGCCQAPQGNYVATMMVGSCIRVMMHLIEVWLEENERGNTSAGEGWWFKSPYG